MENLHILKIAKNGISCIIAHKNFRSFHHPILNGYLQRRQSLKRLLIGICPPDIFSTRAPGIEFCETFKSTSSVTNMTVSENLSQVTRAKVELDYRIFNIQSGETDTMKCLLKMDWLAPKWDNRCFAESSKKNGF